MKLSMQEVLNLSVFIDGLRQTSFKIKTAYKLSKLMKALEPEREFYSQKLQELITTYGERDNEGKLLQANDGNGVKIQKDKLEDFEREVQDLWSIEVEIPAFSFDIEEFDGLDWKIDSIIPLLPFLKG